MIDSKVIFLTYNTNPALPWQGNTEDQNIRKQRLQYVYLKTQNNINITLKWNNYICTLRLNSDIEDAGVSASSFYIMKCRRAA